MSALSCRRMAASVVLAFVFISCDQSPVRPLGADVVGPTGIVSLRLTAPTDLPPGASSQLSAQAYRSDGSVVEVTEQAEWSVAAVPAAALALTASGYAAAREIGRATVRARFSNQSAEATIFVVSPGTFRIAGFVRACGISGLSNATVSVISGPRAGLAAQTDSNGSFELYGLAGAVTIRATKDEFITATREMQVTTHAEMIIPMDDVRGGGAGCWD